MLRKLLVGTAAVALVAGFAIAAELKSGPQVGDAVPGPFAPLNINGSKPGEKICQFCANGDSPVVLIFARNPGDAQTQKLIKEVDTLVAKHEKCEMGSYVVFCTDDSKAEAACKELVEKNKYSKVILTLDSPAGPAKYKFAKEADVTVVLYTARKVKANHTFKAGELKDEAIAKVLKDVAVIVPESK